jgi:hypothetical protein
MRPLGGLLHEGRRQSDPEVGVILLLGIRHWRWLRPCRGHLARSVDVEATVVPTSPQRWRHPPAAAGLVIVGAGSESSLRGHGGGCEHVGSCSGSGEVD